MYEKHHNENFQNFLKIFKGEVTMSCQNDDIISFTTINPKGGVNHCKPLIVEKENM